MSRFDRRTKLITLLLVHACEVTLQVHCKSMIMNYTCCVIEGLTGHSPLDKPHPLTELTSRVEIGSYFLHCSCLLKMVESTGNIFPAGVRVTVDIDVCTCMYQLSHCGALAADILQQILINVPPPNLLSPTISHLLHHSKYTLNRQTRVWINKKKTTQKLNLYHIIIREIQQCW